MIDANILFAWGATCKKLSEDDIIFQEGTYCNFYYQVLSGSIKWVNINNEGREFLQSIIGPGECFGELPLFDNQPYAASAIAIEETVIIRLHKTTFHQILSEQPSLHFAFSKLLAERVRFKFYLLKELAYNDPEHKISALIEYFKKEHKLICPKCHQIKLTRQQIADMTGLRVETVIRAIRNMHEKGELFIDKGKVYTTYMIPVIQQIYKA